MKINNKDIVIFTLVGLIFVLLLHSAISKRNMLEFQKELLLAQQPSEVEIQKTDLEVLEGKWRGIENNINIKRSEIEQLKERITEEEKVLQEQIESKLRIEKSIQEKREEMLGIKK